MLKLSDEFMKKVITPVKSDIVRDELIVTISVITNIEYSKVDRSTKELSNYQLESLKEKMLTGLYEFNDAIELI